ncbi:nucleotidyltransferase domain-containing protein [Hymenobacter terrenus]|uniref:nucleotidyltransferase domain-containing protein n=1 Tax=Hymenobacter terrenus TaxID=1629124 RepID=UPI00373FD7FF
MFGSYAYGTPKGSSDLDLLIIKHNAEAKRAERSIGGISCYEGLMRQQWILSFGHLKKWPVVRCCIIL